MAKLLNVEQQTNNKFLNMYNLEYHNEKTGKDFNYYVASRKDKDNLVAVTGDHGKADAAMMFCMYKNGDVALIKQFRPAINSYVYESPAGLIDAGENAIDTVKREVFEETGLQVLDCYELIKPSYTSEGMSDESLSVWMCEVDGEPDTSHKEENEDIEVVTVKAKDILRFLKEENVSIKTSMMLLMMYTILKD